MSEFKIFITFFTVQLKYLTRNIPFMSIMLIMPIVVVIFSQNALNSNTNSIICAIFDEELSENSQSLTHLLLENEEISFVTASSAQDLRDGVARGEFEAGYIILSGFSKAVQEANMDENIEVVSLEGSVFTTYLDLQVTKAVQQVATLYIAEIALEEYGLEFDVSEIGPQIESHLNAENAFRINIQNDEGGLVATSVEYNAIKGIIAISVTAMYILGFAMSSIEQGTKNFLKPHISPMKMRLYQSAPIAAVATMSAVFSNVVFAWLAGLSIFFGLFDLLMFQATLYLLVLALTTFIGKDVLVLTLPIVSIFIMVTHPILLDITVFFARIRPFLALLPTYQYISGGGVLYYGFVAFLFIIILKFQNRRRKSV